MNTNIKNITIEFVCNNCLRKKSIYLCISIEMNDLTDLIMSKKCLSCGKGGLDVSHINFAYEK